MNCHFWTSLWNLSLWWVKHKHWSGNDFKSRYSIYKEYSLRLNSTTIFLKLNVNCWNSLYRLLSEKQLGRCWKLRPWLLNKQETNRKLPNLCNYGIFYFFLMCTTYAGSNYQKDHFLFFLITDAKHLDLQLGSKMIPW